MHKFAVDYSDAVVQASSTIDEDVLTHIKKSKKPFMSYPGDEDYVNSYQNFYDQYIDKEEDSVKESILENKGNE
ncbi:MAG: hypothetical protein P8N46_00090 [Flavobacteriales bacterium]|nr:hypothetical protein [Flavobacteriales bacterium]